MVAIRAFGYLPLDTVLVPIEDNDYDFDLAVDQLVGPTLESLLVQEVERIEFLFRSAMLRIGSCSELWESIRRSL